jgi:hypothetical protein
VEEESLPFEVELERLPPWVHAASALVLVVGALVATRLVHMLVLLPFLVVSSLGRRFSSSALHVEVHGDGIALGDREVPRGDLADVWVDRDKTEPRATVAFGPNLELAVLQFENADQASRFGEAVAALLPEDHPVVVGHRPRALDLLPSLRFVAIAAAFFGTGSPYGLFVLVFLGLGAWPVLRAKQLVVTTSRLELRGFSSSRSFAREAIAGADLDTGALSLRDGGELVIPRADLRDTTLASPAWLERARSRALANLRR